MGMHISMDMCMDVCKEVYNMLEDLHLYIDRTS